MRNIIQMILLTFYQINPLSLFPACNNTEHNRIVSDAIAMGNCITSDVSFFSWTERWCMFTLYKLITFVVLHLFRVQFHWVFIEIIGTNTGRATDFLFSSYESALLKLYFDTYQHRWSVLRLICLFNEWDYCFFAEGRLHMTLFSSDLDSKREIHDL